MSRHDRATYLTYRGLAGALQFLPRPVASWIATAAGLIMLQLWKGKRPLLRRNLRRVLGPDASDATIERYVQRSFDSYAHYWVEAARVASIDDRPFGERWSAEGVEPLQAAVAEGRGVILALPHLGNWEYGGRWLGENGLAMTAVAEPIEPPELFEWFVHQRERLGLTILPLRRDTGATLVRVLREGKVVGLLADRDLAGDGVEVEFFGERTTLPAGPATLALRTGALLATCAVYHYPGDWHHGLINPPIDCTRTGRLRADVTRVTEQVARELEVLIRRAPEQWHMFQPNWPSDREVAGQESPARAT